MNRYESTKKVGFLGIISNLFLMIIKFTTALISKSSTMMADAINSAGDIFSSIMTYIGNKISEVPSDEDHNFGHGKAEYIFSMLISIFMLCIATKIFIDSIISIITKQKFIFSYYLIIICIITIFIKLSLYLYTKSLLKKHNNILIKASMKDHRNDTFLTIGTLLSVILGYYGYYFFDGIFGSITSIYIFISGLSIFLESYKVLMDISISNEEKEKITNFILKQDNIKAISDFYTVSIGYKYIAIITIDLPGKLDTFTTHKIADDIEKEITKNFNNIYKVIIHVNPI